MTSSSQNLNRNSPLTRVLSAPAKVNLFLSILDKRDDGFHNLESAFTAISLADSISVRSREDGKIQCHSRVGAAAFTLPGFDFPPDEENLATKALELLKAKSGVSQGADIEILKRIPAQAGLGGASSDAAAALLAGNRIWRLELSTTELERIGAEIGSDVPFFIRAVSAVVRGRGEVLQPLTHRPQRLWLVLAKPSAGLSTARVFANLAKNRTEPDKTNNVLDFVDTWQSRSLPSVAKALFNSMERPAYALAQHLTEVGHKLNETTALGYGMSGSGTCHYGIYRNGNGARRAASLLRARGIPWVTVAKTLHEVPR
jgi:4-diphosphocytidyl-2-C-methyl-D-erythritol kinase